MGRESAIYSRGRTYYVAGVGILFDYGTEVPADGLADYAPGCIFQHTDGTSSTVFYINAGTLASCVFNVAASSAALEAALLLSSTPGGASIVGVFDTAGYFAAATVEAVLAEIGLLINTPGTAAGRGASPLIWANCPWLKYMLNPELGMVYFNDFMDEVPALAAAQTVAKLSGGIVGFTAATGATIAKPADEFQGAIKLLGTTDDMDNGICILGGLNTGGGVKLTSGKKFWFEARIKGLNIDNDTAGIFCGFAEEGLLATTALIEAAGTLVAKDYIGFHRLEADGDKLDTVHRKEGGAAVTVAADAVTLVANTYKKIGIYCDGTTIKFYADGVLLGDTALLATGTVPTDEIMAFYFVQMLAATAAFNSNIDWVRIAQEF